MGRIVHLGLGNFHRAHQAWYTARTGGWSITGVVMTNRALQVELAAHYNSYALGIWGSEGLRAERIAVHDEIFLARSQSAEIVRGIADADTHVVTLTITEKGYHLSPQTARLDIAAEPIARDLTAAEPSTALGLLAAGLVLRQGGGPLTVISCDNLADNGRKLRQAVLDYMSVLAPQAVDWVRQQVSFPNTMVDRITPKLTQSAQAEICEIFGQSPFPTVGTEAFTEWVIEDDFRAPRPAWEDAGAVITNDVAPFEERKLRMLNAAHSYLAYAGTLAGHQFVHEAIADPDLLAQVHQIWDEASATISAPAAETLAAYREALIARFSVPAMRHALSQIAMDGSVKIKERIAPIIAARAELGMASPACREAVSCWIRFLRVAVGDGSTLPDPNATEIGQIIAEGQGVEQRLQALAGVDLRNV